ncbi:dehydrogenase/transketolase family protein, partial [mine drainage metagenome]
SANYSGRRDLDYFYADGLDLAAGYRDVARAVEHCRRTRRPTFLHLRTMRVMGHAGTDFEIEWRSVEELVAVEAGDPLLRSAAIALESGVYTHTALLELYEATRARCFAAAEEADRRPKLESLAEVIAPLAPYTPVAVAAEAARVPDPAQRLAVFGGADKLPEQQPPRHLALQINAALHDLLIKYPEALLFGEDVAQKGGVYTVTKGLFKAFSGKRVFNTLLDETMILGLAQGYANMGLLPIPRDPVPGVFPQRLRPDPRRGRQPAILQQRPVPQSDAGAHRRAGLPARLRRALSQRQLDHRAARHPRTGRRLPIARRRRRQHAAHA